MKSHTHCLSTHVRALVSLLFFLLLLSLYVGGDRNLPVKWILERSVYSAVLFATVMYVSLILGKFKYILIAPILFVVSLGVGFRVYFGERVSLAVLHSILDTNIHEAALMLVDTCTIFIIAIPVSVILMLLFARLGSGVRPRIAVILILASAALAIEPAARRILLDDRFLSDVEAYPESLGEIYYSANNLLFGDIVVMLTAYLTEIKYKTVLDKKSNDSVRHLAGPKSKLVVLVIGEASLSTRYSAYGYNARTSPNIDRLSSDPDACIVRDAHSASPVTRESIAMTLSFATPENTTPLFAEKSLIELAEEHSYRTYWVSSQSISGKYDSKYGFLARDSDEIVFTKWNDSELPKRLVDIIQNGEYKDRNKFIVIHMAGSHAPYDNYDVTDSAALPGVENYDKTIHKTDRIFEAIVDALQDVKESNYSLMFVSDHGEIVGKGHGITYGGPSQYLVPLVIKATNGKQICQFIEGLRSRDGYINTLSNKFILLRMMGYDIDPVYIGSEIRRDRVLHSNGKVYDWAAIVSGDL